MREVEDPGFTLQEIVLAVLASKEPARYRSYELVCEELRIGGLAPFKESTGKSLHEAARMLWAAIKLAREPLGYRVKSSDGLYVHRKKVANVPLVGAYPEKSEPTSKADAYRLMADWLDAGYLPVLVRIFQSGAQRRAHGG